MSTIGPFRKRRVALEVVLNNIGPSSAAVEVRLSAPLSAQHVFLSIHVARTISTTKLSSALVKGLLFLFFSWLPKVLSRRTTVLASLRHIVTCLNTIRKPVKYVQLTKMRSGMVGAATATLSYNPVRSNVPTVVIFALW